MIGYQRSETPVKRMRRLALERVALPRHANAGSQYEPQARFFGFRVVPPRLGITRASADQTVSRSLIRDADEPESHVPCPERLDCFASDCLIRSRIEKSLDLGGENLQISELRHGHQAVVRNLRTVVQLKTRNVRRVLDNEGKVAVGELI
jgi:hypothetical protein